MLNFYLIIGIIFVIADNLKSEPDAWKHTDSVHVVFDILIGVILWPLILLSI